MLREKLLKVIEIAYGSKDIVIFDIDAEKHLVFYRVDHQFVAHRYYKLEWKHLEGDENTSFSEDEKALFGEYGLQDGNFLEDFKSASIAYLQKKGEIDKLIYNAFVDDQVAFLRTDKEVTFSYQGRIFHISASLLVKGWDVKVFETIEDVEVGCDADGGLCTGSIRDAIEFML